MTDIMAMAMFALIMSITPGPVNFVTLNSGLNHGFRKTFSYISGATTSFTLLLFFLGLGFSSVIMAYPKLLNVLNYLGSLYMMYLGYIITKSPMSNRTTKVNQAPRFLDGALLQCSNPKAWIACLSGISAFSKANSLTPLLTFVSIYFLICYASISFWAFAGVQLQSILNSDRYKQWISRCMGSLLIITGISLILQSYRSIS